MKISGKIAIVTGASSGIGRATAKLLHQHGAKVVLAARNQAKLKQLSLELPGSLVIPTDMTQASQIKRLVTETVKQWGRVDILINNAGRGYDATILETNPQTLRDLFELDLMGPLLLMQQVIPLMKRQGGGAIINVSSGTALMALPNMGGYSALKRALAGLSLTADEELKPDHIRIGVVYPYMTATDFEKNTLKEKNQSSWGEADLPGNIPPPDPPELVAEKILRGIETGSTEIMVHDFSKF